MVASLETTPNRIAPPPSLLETSASLDGAMRPPNNVTLNVKYVG